LPESLVFERLRLPARNPDVGPAARASSPVSPRPSLTLSEKQLIQALLQDPEMGRVLEPFLQPEFLAGVNAGPVLAQLIREPAQNVEMAVETLQDEHLQREVRAAVLEPFRRITREQAMASVAQLYDAHLVKKEREIREQLKSYGSGAAPADLVRRHQEIAAERSRFKVLNLENTQV
jgi:hypothetical protein